MSKYQKFVVPRPVVRIDTTNAGQAIFHTRSFTKAGSDAPEYHPVVDVVTGFVFCDCKDFHYRHAKHEPTINDVDHHCKHVEIAIEKCHQSGELAQAQSFYHQRTAAVVAALTTQSQEFKSVNVAYVSAIYETARRKGFEADYARVEGSVLYRVEVFNISQRDFSELLNEASKSLRHAA